MLAALLAVRAEPVVPVVLEVQVRPLAAHRPQRVARALLDMEAVAAEAAAGAVVVAAWPPADVAKAAVVALVARAPTAKS